MSIILRDYQRAGIMDIRDAMRDARRVLYVLPTGAGKTISFAYIARGVQQKKKRVLILAHRRELLRQISQTLDKWGVNHAVLNADSRGTPRATVVVASVFTFVNRMQFFQDVELVVVDEAHHAALGTTWSRALGRFPNAKILGVTATPLRLDGKGLGENFDRLVVGPGVAELTAMGYLSPAEVYAPKNALDLRGIRITGGDYAPGELAAAMDTPTITGDAVTHYKRIADGKKAVAFCCSIEHAKDVAAEFTLAGYMSEHVDGRLDDYERDARLMRFARGQTKVLTSCDLISEGFDMPSIEVAILLRPTKSLALYMQQVGRAVRPAPGKERTIVLDHAGNTQQHGFVDEVRAWDLSTRTMKMRERAAPVSVCPQCYAMHAPAPVCPKCKYEYVTNPREVKRVDGELEKISRNEDISAAAEEADLQKRFAILVNVAKYKQMENPERWARDIIFGQVARQLAKQGREPDGFMINGLTVDERDRLMRMIKGTNNQIEMVV